MDHEGLIKEITWTGTGDGGHVVIHPEIHEYTPECAPERLYHAAAYGLPRVLEIAIFCALLGALLATLANHLIVRLESQPQTPSSAPKGAPIVLADFPTVPVPGPLCSMSCFVTEVEALLRFNHIDYLKKVSRPGSPSPKGQIPFIERGPLVISDSGSILTHLASNGDIPVTALYPSDPRQRATALVVARLAENDLNATVLWYRWVDPQNWARNRAVLMRGYRLPRIVEAILVRFARKGIYTRVWEHGLARHSEEERWGLVTGWLGSLAALVPARGFMFGRSPHAVDAAVFGVLDQFAARSLNPQLADLLAGFPGLTAYHERIRQQFFSELAQWIGKGGTGNNAQATSKAVGKDD